jgi:hypothetical protein
MFMDCNIVQYSDNLSSSQTDLQIKHNSNQNPRNTFL